ncbi:MAG: dolichol-phosphate mannosyltransferase [Deltaproteobacteria bacterium]|nr:dolichol-phosphate mannosyltransferase [Deltaproteobacteria bacterium]
MKIREKASFVVPVYNEVENLRVCFGEVDSVASELFEEYEVLFVDDCSDDQSLGVIKELAQQHPRVKYLSLEEHAGQSAALAAGFQYASGDIIITLDADLQNDPSDIRMMMQYYPEHDVVNGWRHNRRDTLSKKVSSKIGNFVRNKLTHETIRDTGCSLKIMRASMLKRVKMFKNMHRFLPTLMRLEGARVVEVKVNHRPRLKGTSKYTNLRRGAEGLYDVIVVRWMTKRHLSIRVREKNV